MQTCSNEIKGMFETVRLFLERYASRHEAAFKGRPGHRQEQERERSTEGEGAVYVQEAELDSRKKRPQKIKKFFRLRPNRTIQISRTVQKSQRKKARCTYMNDPQITVTVRCEQA